MMLRSILNATRSIRCLGSQVYPNIPIVQPQHQFTFGFIRSNYFNSLAPKINLTSPFTPITSSLGLLQPRPVLTETIRTNIKFSRTKGKRKTKKIVLKKFLRLNWGIWIHAKCGRSKKLYKKSANRRRRLQYHVFSNGTQSHLLDKMVTRYWRKPRHYVDDPYEPYHTRNEFQTSRMKPYHPFL